METPEANIYWRDITSEHKVAEGPHLFVVTAPDGTRAVAYWMGSEAREAQRKLRELADLTAKRALPVYVDQSATAKGGLPRSVIEDHGPFGVWWYALPGGKYQWAYALKDGEAFQVGAAKSGLVTYQAALEAGCKATGFERATEDEEAGMKAIVALQQVAGITETENRALYGWRNMTAHERAQTMLAYQAMFG
jgi:hypothetical protein